jgi:hypothetical protein
MVDSSLPHGFEALEPFVEAWAVAGAANRAHRRTTSSEPERLAFYNVAADMIPAALACLDRKPLEAFDDKEKRLMNLLLSLCHVALAVEVQGDDEARHAQCRQHLQITRASSDPGS